MGAREAAVLDPPNEGDALFFRTPFGISLVERELDLVGEHRAWLVPGFTG